MEPTILARSRCWTKSIFFWLKQEAVAGQIGKRLQSSSSESILAPPPGYLCCLLNEHSAYRLCVTGDWDWEHAGGHLLGSSGLSNSSLFPHLTSVSAIESLKKTQTSIPSSRASRCCTGAQGSRVPSFSLLSFLLAIYNKLHLLWPINVIYLNSQEPQSYWFGVTLVANELSRVLSP